MTITDIVADYLTNSGYRVTQVDNSIIIHSQKTDTETTVLAYVCILYFTTENSIKLNGGTTYISDPDFFNIIRKYVDARQRDLSRFIVGGVISDYSSHSSLEE